MKIEDINLKRKIRTDANQISHYHRQIKDYNIVLIIYDIESKREFYFEEDEIYNYNGSNSAKRYKKSIHNYKNYLDEDLNDYAFENHILVYSKYFKKHILEYKTNQNSLHNYQIEIIKNIKRTFKREEEEERNFFINNVANLYQNKEDLFMEYLKEFHLKNVNRERFNRILKQIDNKTIFFNLNNKDKLNRKPISYKEHIKYLEDQKKRMKDPLNGSLDIMFH